MALLSRHSFGDEIGRFRMSAPSRGMGRGLAEILRVSGSPAPTGDDLRNVPVELIVPNPKQPRRSAARATPSTTSCSTARRRSAR